MKTRTRLHVNMTWQERLDNYKKETGFPQCLFIAEDGRVVGTFIMGNDYRVQSNFYGGYPAGYLRRMKALFPDKQSVVHLFAGVVNTKEFPGKTVDINPDLVPDYVDDAQTLDKVPFSGVDLVLADPPYSIEDSVHYGTSMVHRNKVLKALAAKVDPGTHIVWLDQVLPMYRKDELKIEALIGMVKSTNHRFRVVVVFRRL
jgi:hypothetical protein